MGLLALFAGLECAVGQKGWKTYSDGKLAWSYKLHRGGGTCKIKPADRAAMKEDVTIPSEVQDGAASIRVTEIARQAFKGCEELIRVTIPQGVTIIGQSAFEECKALREVELPEGVVEIRQEAFKLCPNLQSVTFPSSLRALGLGAFFHCNSLTKIVIPAGIEEICIGAFQRCTHLKEVVMPTSLKRIETYVFAECNRLEEIVIPESVEAIGASAFEKCVALVKVNLPSRLKRLEPFVFQECELLKSIAIPRALEEIDKAAFVLCSGLEKFEVAEDNERYRARAGVIYSKDGKTIECYPRGRRGSYAIPEGVTTVGKEAFSGCEGLDSIFIPASVTAIEMNGFGNTRMATVTIPSSVKKVGSFAFTYCENLKEVVLLAAADVIPRDDYQVFNRIARNPVLYVRPGEKAKVKGAKWLGQVDFEVREMHAVSFNANGGSPEPAVQYVKSDGKHLAIAPSTLPGKAYYSFKGWFQDGASEKYDFSTPVTSSFTLTAKWEKKSAADFCRVTFAVQDDEGAPLAGANVAIKDGKQQVVLSKPTDVKGLVEAELANGNYAYEVSHEGSEGRVQGRVEVAGEEAAVDVRLTLKKYTVNFNPDNGTLPYEKTVRHGKQLEEPAVPEKQDCEFLGWFANGSKYDFKKGVTSSMNLTARWKAVMIFTITFDAAGGAPVPQAQKVQVGMSARRPADPERPEYQFKGWYRGEELYAFDTPIEDNITLVAHWEYEGMRTVTFNADGGTPEPPRQQVKDGARATRPADPERPGYQFKGWYLNGVFYNFERPVTGNITLVARWSVASGVESLLLAGTRVVGNPVGEVLGLEGAAAAERVEVYSLTGMLVYSRALRGESRVEVAASRWASGLYVVRVVARDGERALRFVKL